MAATSETATARPTVLGNFMGAPLLPARGTAALVFGAAVIGAFWSPHLGWLLAKVVLAGIIGGTLVSEVGSKFSLTRACYGWLAAYLRRALR